MKRDVKRYIAEYKRYLTNPKVGMPLAWIYNIPAEEGKKIRDQLRSKAGLNKEAWR